MIDKSKLYYLAGMMRPLPDHNFPLFERVSKMLRLDGYRIISPHEMGEPSMTRGELMTDDLLAILHVADGIICLPGWEASSGASAEVAVAFATEKPVYEIFVPVDNDDFVIFESKAVSAYVPREQQYAEGLPLIGMCGYAQSGKDTVASYLVKEQGWTRVAFADALREVLWALNPLIEVTYEAVYEMTREEPVDFISFEKRVQDLVLENGWDEAKVTYTEIRQLLQRLGTEAGRQVINENLWVRLGEEKLEAAGTPVVVTDCRFKNELDLIKRRKGLLIWVDRPGVGPANSHASEHSVTESNCDFLLINDGTIEDLHRKVDKAIPHSYRTENADGILCG